METERYYGADAPRRVDDDLEVHAEELTTLGYTVIEGVLTSAELGEWRQRNDAVYAQQEIEFGGREALAARSIYAVRRYYTTGRLLKWLATSGC